MSDVTIDNLPDMLTTDDMATLLRIDVEAVRHQVRKHKEILKPFKLGREVRVTKESFEIYYSLLQNQKIS